MKLNLIAALLLACSAAPTSCATTPDGQERHGPDLALRLLGTHASGLFAQGASEIVAHDPVTQRLFVVNAAANQVDVLDVSDPRRPTRLFAIDLAPYGAGANSVAVARARGGNGHGGESDRVRRSIVAVAVEADPKQAPGRVVFLDTDGQVLSSVSVGALPDMVTFTPDARTVLVANEGEPNDDYTVDPEGSISVIDVARGVADLTDADVRTVGFTHLTPADLPHGTRVFGPGASVAQDLEPEYIACSADSREAYVTLQEASAIAVVDVRGASLLRILALGAKDHALPGSGLDPSNRDGGIHIANWPVHGMYQPDSIAAFPARGETYLVTANEGDSRDYDGFSEEARVADLALDPAVFPDAAALQAPAGLGRLKVTTVNGDADGDGLHEQLFSFGARSFSIWTTRGERVYDSGDALERLTAEFLPADFNSDNEENGSFDGRSDDKGPEPEGLALGRVNGRWLLFVGLERIGGIALFDVSDPRRPVFQDYVNPRDFAGDPEAGTAGDLGPEGLCFVPAEESPTHRPLLAVGNEISGTTTLFEITRR